MFQHGQNCQGLSFHDVSVVVAQFPLEPGGVRTLIAMHHGLNWNSGYLCQDAVECTVHLPASDKSDQYSPNKL